MLAALFDGKGKMQLSQIDKPELSAGGVIVELQAVGICGSDLQIKTDQTNKDTFPAGHELAGTIVDVSPEISKGLIGKRVSVEGIGQGRACMECWYCRSGQYVKCSHRNPRGGGGFAEFLTTQAIGCYELPDSMSWAAGALVEPLSVSVHAVRRGKLKGGETVVVIGAGSIGLTAIAAAKALGAGKLFASSRHSHQTKMATDLGADYAFENDFDSLNEAVLEATQGRGADITIEPVGGWNSDAINQAITTTRKPLPTTLIPDPVPTNSPIIQGNKYQEKITGVSGGTITIASSADIDNFDVHQNQQKTLFLNGKKLQKRKE